MILVGEVTICVSRCVQCLGVNINRRLDMKKQVSKTTSACSFCMRNIHEISGLLPRPTKERVFNAIITSQLDYCNNTSTDNIARLQRIHISVDYASPTLRQCYPCYANSSSSPLCAKLTSSYLYSITKPCTTTRQCICVDSCAGINREDHCALRATTR